MTRRLGLAGAVVIVIFAAVAVAGPLVAPYPASATAGAPFLAPGPHHWLGTDDVGHDILSQLIDGTRVSLILAAGVAGLSKLLAAVVGIVAGSVRGAVDVLLMRAVDLVLVVPTLPLIVFIGAYLGGAVLTQVLVMAAVLWAASARLIRAQAIATRDLPYVRASRSFGASTAHVVWRHIVPAVLPVTVAAFVRTAGTAILLQSSLAYLGLGDPAVNSWGSMIHFAQARGALLTGAWVWWMVPPGLCIAAVVVATAFAGLLVEDRLDPRLAARSRARAAPATSVRLAGKRGAPLAWSAQPDVDVTAEAATRAPR